MSLSLSVYIVDYYLARKKEEILSLASPWTNLEDIILNEISQKEKNTVLISLICEIQKKERNS